MLKAKVNRNHKKEQLLKVLLSTLFSLKNPLLYFHTTRAVLYRVQSTKSLGQIIFLRQSLSAGTHSLTQFYFKIVKFHTNNDHD